jgi:ribonuclease P protein component
MGFACACAPAPGAPSCRPAVAGAAPASPADQFLTSRRVLAKAARLRTAEEFRTTVRRGARCGRPTLVLHMMRTDNPPSRAGFVVSKAVGNAVRRNRVKRQLRHLVAVRLAEAPFALDVVVRALPGSGTVADDLDQAWTLTTAKLAGR